MKRTAAAAVLAWLAVCQPAVSAELGSLTVDSKFGEPFSARLEITGIDANVPSLQVRLAPEKTYQAAGKKAPADLKSLKLALESLKPCIVRVRGSENVSSPEYELIFQLKEGDTVRSKEYPVSFAGAAPVALRVDRENVIAVSASDAGVEPEAPAAQKEPAGAVKEPVPEKLAKPSVETAKARVPSSGGKEHAGGAKPEARPVKVPGKLRREDPATLEPVTLPLDPKDYDLDRPFLVRPGMTMWSIALLYKDRYPKCLVQQVIVGFVRTNPKCFEGGRTGDVIFGSYLVAPSLKLVRSIPQKEAIDLVNRHPTRSALKGARR